MIVGLVLLCIVMAITIVSLVKSGVQPPSLRELDNKPSIPCTEEAKLCPDGSAVGREGPNCEFPECPEAPAALPVN